MRRTKLGALPSVEVVESRVLLSTASPLLSKHALSEVVREVRAIMSTLARTEDTVQASRQLTRLSSRIASGPEQLALSWQSDLGLDDPHSLRSVIRTQRRILGDLDRYVSVQGGIAGGNRPVVSGSGSTTSTTSYPGAGGTANPLPEASLDSVKIQNTTGLALLVTIHLKVPQVQQPWITETIPAEGNSIVLFNFGTATNVFMTMDVSLANGGQTPTPLTNLSLSQPLTGYNGALFAISLVGPYFNVSAS